MADNVTITEGSGTTIAADEIASVKYQRVKLSVGDDGSATDANSGAGAVAAGTLRMTLASDDPAVVALQLLDNCVAGSEMQVDIVSGTVTANLSATDNAVLDNIDTNTDFGQVTGGGVESGALRVTIASDSTGVLTVDDGGSTISIDDGGGAITVDGTVTANLSATDNAVLDAIDTNTDNIPDALAGEYETVAASQTAQALGATGATGDFISHVLVIPATTSPGNVILIDNATSITIFTGGTDSVSNLVPFHIPLQMYSASGAWSITTGANVSVIAVGNFT